MRQHVSRRAFLGSLAGAAFAGTLPARAGERGRPNVVMIVGDDMGWTDLGFMGHTVVRTPRLDRLARESATFPNGYTPTSLCRASLATLLTGLYPHQHRICCNDPPAGVDRTEMHPFIRTAPTIPRLLGTAGYRSLQTGKFWEGHFSNAGFTHGQTTNRDRHIATQVAQIGRTGMQPITDFIDANRTSPFFVWYAPMMPHRPHNPPERLLNHYLRDGRDRGVAAYYAMCEWFDETAGQLLDHLDRRRLADDTLVVFVIDNGWVQPTAGQNNSPAYGGDRGKRSPYDMGIRTPVLLRWPGHTRAGRYDDLVLTIDLAPTILTAAGVRVPEQMKGLNLLDVAAGNGHLRRPAVFGEIYVHTASQVGRPDLDVTHRWVREGDWKLILPVRGTDPPELFDLAHDPHERTNLAPRQPDRARHLRQLIDQWVAMR
jgi:uncharacterized sulfatase